MESKLTELKARLIEINDLESAAALLNWDQSTYMPSGGTSARARQLATLARLAHDQFVDPAVGKLLDELQTHAASLPPDFDDAALIRVTQRDYERATKLPSAFVGELYSHMAQSYEIWTRARPANDFKMVEPYLEKTLDLSRQYAEYFPGYDHVADPLIEGADYGMKAASVRAVFGQLRDQLVPLVKKISALPLVDDSAIRQFFPEALQLDSGLEVIKAYGYDFTRGRQDKTHHPFMTKFSLGDVRITTRVNEHDFGDALFSTLHESGHALYEQGIAMKYEGTPLANGTSAGVHESQSRLWENLVGRSRGFWQHWYPQVQRTFPEQLGSVPLDTFYRAINKVQPSLIRVDADEVTYNLHVMLRFGLELELLEGSLEIRDLPEAWWERYTSDLGVTPTDDKDGVLQDVHWYGGLIGGAFQGYTLGNIMSAQFYDAALATHPAISSEVAAGEYGTLHGWLRENIYQHGRKYTTAELIARTTGGELSIEPYIRYLQTKYGELYGLK